MAPNAADSPVLLRRLGAAEAFSVHRSRLGLYNNVCVTGTYSASPGANLKDDLYRAARGVVEQHQVLSAGLADNDPSRQPAFVRLPEINLDQIITIEQCGGSKGVEGAAAEGLEGQHNTPFDLDSHPAPLWRLHVIDDRPASGEVSICFCFHHSIMDTKSALVFHEDLLQSLVHPGVDDASAIIKGPPGSLLPTLESLNPLPVSSEYINLSQTSSEPGDEVWSGKPQVVPVKTSISYFWLSSSTSRSFRQRCKENKSSPTALIMSALASSIFMCVPHRYTTVYGDCAVSLRPSMPPPISSRSMGCYVGTFSEKYSRSSMSLWDDAQRTKETIVAAQNNRCADCPLGLVNHVPDVGGLFRGKLGKKRWTAFELSNVGTLENTAPTLNGNYDIDSLLFSQSAGGTSAVLKVSVASGKDGRLGFSCSWQKGVVDDGLIREIITSFRHVLEDI